MSLASLPAPFLHLLSRYLASDPSSVIDSAARQSSPLFTPIINFTLVYRLISRVAKLSLANCFKCWELFVRTIVQNTRFATTAKYMEFSHDWSDFFVQIPFLETLISYAYTALYPGSFIWHLTSQSLHPQKTLKAVSCKPVHLGRQVCVVQINTNYQPEAGGIPQQELPCVAGGGVLASGLAGLSVCADLEWPNDESVETKTVEEDGKKDEGDVAWVDEGNDDDDDDDDYDGSWGSGSEESDWDSEDESDYEDDWEAEMGGIVPSSVLRR